MIGCLQTRVCMQPIIALYFESENELKFYNLEARKTKVIRFYLSHDAKVTLKSRFWCENVKNLSYIWDSKEELWQTVKTQMNAA